MMPGPCTTFVFASWPTTLFPTTRNPTTDSVATARCQQNPFFKLPLRWCGWTWCTYCSVVIVLSFILPSPFRVSLAFYVFSSSLAFVLCPLSFFFFFLVPVILWGESSRVRRIKKCAFNFVTRKVCLFGYLYCVSHDSTEAA
ncbi:hypothetical protein BDP55DRAFT_211564 [Colletotrichum godetiae]|uniref:Uncharacterized protein n=1 Tax=Colletotrichum godetiae TaxID=1209918 RepID=A0AAJ0AYP1_9PEZI|nr:uncharacterized protein BDP55DRAFT_211564 [Colletotrichum godetiae]KAK1699920.1 hypothetical protein BDP55DRAFT_211564 [Colletotrichum godetiae]